MSSIIAHLIERDTFQTMPKSIISLYLIGVHHNVQHNGYVAGRCIPPKLKALREQFRYYLARTIREHGICVLAEELNDDVLAICNASTSYAKSIAEDHGITHAFCEPGVSIRAALGFSTHPKEQNHLVRERLWYDHLINYKGKRILFICGADHVFRFRELVEKKGQRISVLTPYYAKGFFH